MSFVGRGVLLRSFEGRINIENKGFYRSEISVVLQKSYLFQLKELGDESYIFKKV